MQPTTRSISNKYHCLSLLFSLPISLWLMLIIFPVRQDDKYSVCFYHVSKYFLPPYDGSSSSSSPWRLQMSKNIVRQAESAADSKFYYSKINKNGFHQNTHHQKCTGHFYSLYLHQQLEVIFLLTTFQQHKLQISFW